MFVKYYNYPVWVVWFFFRGAIRGNKFSGHKFSRISGRQVRNNVCCLVYLNMSWVNLTACDTLSSWIIFQES